MLGVQTTRPMFVKFPAGTRFEALAHFDNSTFNPYNPDPKKTVRFGQQTYEEMMYGFFFYTAADENVLALRVGRDVVRIPTRPGAHTVEAKVDATFDKGKGIMRVRRDPKIAKILDGQHRIANGFADGERQHQPGGAEHLEAGPGRGRERIRDVQVQQPHQAQEGHPREVQALPDGGRGGVGAGVHWGSSCCDAAGRPLPVNEQRRARILRRAKSRPAGQSPPMVTTSGQWSLTAPEAGVWAMRAPRSLRPSAGESNT